MKGIRDSILELMGDLSLEESTELLANVMIDIAMGHIDHNNVINNWDDAWFTTINDVKANGDTLANSLARQALTVNAWLVSRKEQGEK